MSNRFPHFPFVNPAHAVSARDQARQGFWRQLRVRNPEAAAFNLFPDFLILGPQRTGTTWIYHNLKKHPQIFLPRKKETYYFTTLNRPDHPHYECECLDDFLDRHLTERFRHRLKRHWDSLRRCRELYRPSVRGEATATNALLAADTIRELRAINPDLKAVLMLRDPIDRAWSHARKDLLRKTGRRPAEVTAAEYTRFFRAGGQRGLASYVELLRTWTSELKPGHLFAGEFEMIASRPDELLTGLHRFLGVRSGPRYFNRHLAERINPAGENDIPEAALTSLTQVLAEEIDQYAGLRPLFSADLAESDAVREQFGFSAVATPTRPCLVSDATGSDRRSNPVSSETPSRRHP